MEPILYFAKQLHSFTGKILYLNLLTMGLISLLEGMGVLMLIPMLSLSGVVNIGTATSPIPRVSEFLQNFPKTLSLPFILSMYILLVIGQNLLQKYLTVQNVKIQQGFFRKLRLETYGALLQAKLDFFMKKRKSDLTHLLTSELARVSAGTNSFLQLLSSIAFTLIQVGIAIWLSAKITFFVLLCGLALTYFAGKFIKRARTLGRHTSELAQQYLAGITDHFNGVKDIKSNMLEESSVIWFGDLTQRMVNEQTEYIKLKTTSQLYYKVSSAVLIAVFIFLSLKLFHAQLEQFLLIILIFSRLWPRITGIQSNMEQIASIIPSFQALIELQAETKKARELKGTIPNYKSIKPICMQKGMECRNVYFRYNPTEPSNTLENINVYIPANRMTAIVGRSGAGKSTLIDILMGLLQPEKGQFLIDEIPLTSENLLSLRRSVSYVPQDPFLFNASIRENLQMIDPEASEVQMWEALKLSSAAEFVTMLPQGLDTFIGDRGVRLSGGERQRLVLARAILRSPSILVLDEATSALDTENETIIQETLDRFKETMTIIVIAHRLSTIRNADQVIVLDHGEIIQTGEFNQLAREKRGLFNNLLGKQLEFNLHTDTV